MDDLRGYKDFVRRMRRAMRSARPAVAPPSLAEDVMHRLSAGERGVAWLGPSVAGAAAMAVAALVMLWIGPAAPRRPGPEIVRFSVDKTQVRLGESVTLSWEVRNAKRVLIRSDRGLIADAGQDTTLTVGPWEPGEHTFVLMAMGENGEAAESLIQ